MTGNQPGHREPSKRLTSTLNWEAIVQGRFLQQNWMTSVHQQAVVIHYINHELTMLKPVDGHLEAIIPALCSKQLNYENLALLDDADALEWLYGSGPLHNKYGPRKQCKGCVR